MEDRRTSGNKFITAAKHGSGFQFVSPDGRNAAHLKKYAQILSNEIPQNEFPDFGAAIQPQNKDRLWNFLLRRLDIMVHN